VLHTRVGYWLYLQILNYAGKACQGKTLKLIWPIHKFRPHKVFTNKAPGSTVVEHWTYNHKIVGSNPATDPRKVKISMKKKNVCVMGRS